MTIAKGKIKKAKETDLVAYCEFKGLEMESSTNGNYKLPKHAGLYIKDNYFKQFGTSGGGDAIKFCMDILKMKFPDAVKDLLAFQESNKETESPLHGSGGRAENKIILFSLPTKSTNNEKVFNYLTKNRGLPADLIEELLDRGLLYQDDNNNCVFPCFNTSGEPTGAIIRGTNALQTYKGWAKGSTTRFGWLIEPEKEAGQVVVTESVIDALSIIGYYPDKPIRREYILAMGGLFINSLKQFLDNHPQVKTIVLAIDNDEAASNIIEGVKSELGDGYEIIEFRAMNKKDWNEELLDRLLFSAQLD